MQINSLISDVQQLLKTKGWMTDALSMDLARETSLRLKAQFTERQGPPTLRLSQMGDRCPKALWYSIHHPELAEPLPPWAENKFAFGNIVEAWAITLAKASGHRVEGEQDVCTVDGVTGHRDCVIDGCVVDVKSCSSRAFTKFKDKSLGQSDSFGYLDQLDGYLVGFAEDPLVTNKTTGYMWAIDKQLGHMCLYSHDKREQNIRDRISTCKAIVAESKPPACSCKTIPDGKSGNIRLDVKASYSAQKWTCKPSIRCFLYADGPHYLTEVKRKPDVPEIDKFGKIIYGIG